MPLTLHTTRGPLPLLVMLLLLPLLLQPRRDTRLPTWLLSDRTRANPKSAWGRGATQ